LGRSEDARGRRSKERGWDGVRKNGVGMAFERTGMGRRSKERGWDGVRKNGDGTVTERRRDGHGHGTKTLASL
jgi:hypothetical protein